MKGLFSTSRMLVAIAGVSTCVGASLLVSGFSSPASVALPQWAGPNYRQDVRGFRPVTRQLLADLKHSPLLLAPPSASTAPRARTQAPGSAQTTAPSAAPSSQPTVPASPSPQAPAARLAVVMTADESTAKPRDTISYTIRVANTGSASAVRLVVESHVPDGTTLRAWSCDGQTVKAVSGSSGFVCGDPGSPAPDHPLVWAFPSLAPGAEVTVQFWVRLDPSVDHNANIVDHAHAYASNVDLTDSDDVSVIVR